MADSRHTLSERDETPGGVSTPGRRVPVYSKGVRLCTGKGVRLKISYCALRDNAYGTAMTRYEYTFLSDATIDDVNQLAAEGWRYVGDLLLMQPNPDAEDEHEETAQPALLFERRTTGERQP